MNRSDLTKGQRWALADRLAEERLPSINEQLEDVVPRRGLYVRFGKRLLDIAISSVALIVSLPINAIIAIITFIDVGRPIFFVQERVGRDGRAFRIVKFRNMTNERDARGELLPASKRVTRFGRAIRSTSLDELLNFWSVLKGDMSIVGPRPLVPEYVNRYNKRHRMRLAVRPGLECPPREDSDGIWTWQEQFDNDVWYVENVSFLTDVRLVWRLVTFTLDRKSSQARAMSERGTFMGYDELGHAINLDGVPQEYIDDFAKTAGGHNA